MHDIADVFADGLARIQADHPDWFVGIRQNGVVIGLEFDHPEGAKFVMRELYENGVWAIFSTLDPRVLQFKPGLLLSRELCDDVLDRFDGGGGQGRTSAATAAVQWAIEGSAIDETDDSFVADDVDVAEPRSPSTTSRPLRRCAC